MLALIVVQLTLVIASAQQTVTPPRDPRDPSETRINVSPVDTPVDHRKIINELPSPIINTQGQPQELPSVPMPVPNQQMPTDSGAGSDSSGSSPYGNMGSLSDLQRMMNQRAGVPGEYYDGPSGSSGEYFGAGKMQACNMVPNSVKTALNEAKTFRAACSYAQRGESQKIAINDYSTRPSYMYIYDLQGKCLGKTLVSFGNGAGGAQIACSDHGSNLSPPGFHLTAEHHGNGKYNPSNSLKMVGLQGQDSAGRGILIHPARAPGTSSSWGCAGVGYDAFGAVKKTLGYGALVYNYWRPEQMGNRCSSRAGMNQSGSCQPDRGSPDIPSNATGTGSPGIAQLISLFELAYASQFPAERLKIKKGTEIIVVRELKSSGTYEIKMVKEEAVGPNVATAEALRSALELNEESLAEFKKRLNRDSGAIYVLKKDLPLLWEEEIYRLQKKKKSK